jgi:hypothetical protein
MVPLTFLIPTRQRPEQLQACINSIIATCGTFTPRFVVGFDDDYTNYSLFLKTSRNAEVQAHYLAPRHYFVRGMNALFKAANDAWDDFDYFVVCNDDDQFVYGGWDGAALDGYNAQFPDGLGVLELAFPKRLHTYFSRAQLFNDYFYGRLYNTAYTQFCGDHELLETLNAADKYRCVENLSSIFKVVKHYWGSTDDTLGQEVMGAWHGMDNTTLRMRRATMKYPPPLELNRKMDTVGDSAIALRKDDKD